MKTLVVFDFDDTLFKSGAMIGVQKPGEPKKYLSSHEYATYVPDGDEEFDYDQFHVYPPDPKPIPKSTARAHSASGGLPPRTLRGNTATSTPSSSSPCNSGRKCHGW